MYQPPAMKQRVLIRSMSHGSGEPPSRRFLVPQISIGTYYNDFDDCYSTEDDELDNSDREPDQVDKNAMEHKNGMEDKNAMEDKNVMEKNKAMKMNAMSDNNATSDKNILDNHKTATNDTNVTNDNAMDYRKSMDNNDKASGKKNVANESHSLAGG